MPENERIIQRLQRLYGNSIDRDCFGRRKALAREIEAVIKPTMNNLDNYLPNKTNLKEKNDN